MQYAVNAVEAKELNEAITDKELTSEEALFLSMYRQLSSADRLILKDSLKQIKKPTRH